MARRRVAFWLAAAALAAGCPKAGEGPDTVPVAGVAGEAAGVSEGAPPTGTGGGRTESVAAATPRVRGAGVWGPLADVAPRAPSPAAQAETVPAEASPVPPRDDFELERMQAMLDLPQLVASPAWALVRQLMQQEAASPCLAALLEQVETLYLDVTLDANGDPQDVLVSARTTSPAAAVVSCFQEAFGGGATFVELSVGGRPAWADPGAGAERGVLVEAEPGWWLLALPGRVERELLSGRRPEDDAAFAELTGPLGPFALRVAGVPRQGAGSTPFGRPEADKPEACLAELWPAVTGFAVGVSVVGSFDGGLAARTGSTEAAEEVRACLASFWNRTLLEAAQEMSPEDQQEFRQVLGMSPQDLAQAATFETVANFAVARASFPLAALLQMLQGKM